MEQDTAEEKIIRDWIEKAKPIVDSAFNLGLSRAADVAKNYFTPDEEAYGNGQEIAELILKLKMQVP